MDREIEFKAYIKDIKKIVDVYDIDFLQETISFMNPYDTQYTCRKFNEVDIIQYTGIKDVNGTKIFEGDIVEITCKFKGKVEFENCGVVKYKDSSFIVDIFTDKEAFDFCLLESIYNNERENTCIVIGNAYDDSELLRSKENETD